MDDKDHLYEILSDDDEWELVGTIVPSRRERKSAQSVVFEQADMDAIRLLADEDGVSASAWIRDAALRVLAERIRLVASRG